MAGPKVHSHLVVKDHGWDFLLKELREQIANSSVKVGVLGEDPKGGGLHEVDPVTGKASDLTVAEIAAVQEFGTADGHVPERSFLRSTFDRVRPELADMGEKLIGAIIHSQGQKMTTERALNIMGAKLAGECKNAITEGEGIPPPNAPSTVAAKGSDRPLVDTGRLVNAITWKTSVHGREEPDAHHDGGDEGGE